MNLNDFFQSSAELFASNTKKGLYTEKLSFKAGNEYLVRLLPYVKEGRAGYHKSIFHFSSILGGLLRMVAGLMFFLLAPMAKLALLLNIILR